MNRASICGCSNHTRTRENTFLKGRAKIARKNVLHKNMLMIRSTITILSLVYLLHNMLMK